MGKDPCKKSLASTCMHKFVYSHTCEHSYTHTNENK